MILDDVGLSGQTRLKNSRVLVVGSGGLGSPVLSYLAAAGVGTLGVVDHDVVDESNLHRQVLFVKADVGDKKVEAAKTRLEASNSNVEIVAYSDGLNSENALQIISKYDLVVDCVDNFATRFLINDACVYLGKKYIFASIYQFEGVLTVFGGRKEAPCYRCLYPEPPPEGIFASCAEAGVLGALPGVLGSMQAVEALKALLDFGDSLEGRVLRIDTKRMHFSELHLTKREGCVCHDPKGITLRDFAHVMGAQCSNVQLNIRFSVDELVELRNSGKQFTLVDVRNHEERSDAHIENDIHIPMTELVEKLQNEDRSSLIVFYCLSGKRSGEAVQRLMDNGFDNVFSLQGGILAWLSDNAIG